MFLQRVTLENVRSIEHLDLPIATEPGEARKWTFLLGENGTGKSTLLRAIALVLAGSEALPELLANPRDWIRFGASSARIHADLVTAEGEERDAEMVIGVDDTIRDVYDRNRSLLEQLDAAFAHSMRSYFTVGYGVSRRPADDDTSPVVKGVSFFRNARARSVATLFSASATLASLESWAIDLDYRRETGFELAREALNTLLPGVTLLHVDKEQRELVFQTPDGPTPYRLLSEGYQNVAAWTGDLLFQITNVFEDFSDPFSARGLLLVDELDLHLHPRWQRQLVEFIGSRFPNFQVIATTHSPLTIHQAGAGELFFLRRESPTAPATLHAYEGAPRDLMLHQLLLSPVFGLATLDSKQVEELKDEYRQLRDDEARTPQGTRRMQSLARQLEDLPDWTDGVGGQEELTSLLRDIKSELSGR